MEFGRLDEIYVDRTGGYGPDVALIRKMANGNTVTEYLPASIATAMLLFDDIENGSTFVSGHIIFGNLLDTWGHSL